MITEITRDITSKGIKAGSIGSIFNKMAAMQRIKRLKLKIPAKK